MEKRDEDTWLDRPLDRQLFYRPFSLFYEPLRLKLLDLDVGIKKEYPITESQKATMKFLGEVGEKLRESKTVVSVDVKIDKTPPLCVRACYELSPKKILGWEKRVLGIWEMMANNLHKFADYTGGLYLHRSLMGEWIDTIRLWVNVDELLKRYREEPKQTEGEKEKTPNKSKDIITSVWANIQQLFKRYREGPKRYVVAVGIPDSSSPKEIGIEAWYAPTPERRGLDSISIADVISNADFSAEDPAKDILKAYESMLNFSAEDPDKVAEEIRRGLEKTINPLKAYENMLNRVAREAINDCWKYLVGRSWRYFADKSHPYSGVSGLFKFEEEVVSEFTELMMNRLSKDERKMLEKPRKVREL